MTQNNNNRDIALKTLLGTLLCFLIILLAFNVFSGGGSGIISRLYTGMGVDFNSFVTFVLVTVVKLMWLVFFFSLIAGIALMFKKNPVSDRSNKPTHSADSGGGYACPCCNTRLTVDFKFCPICKACLKDICMKCGRELQVGWRCCPICGSEKRR